MNAKWQSWEHEVAVKTGGAMVKCSGRLPVAKGDVRTQEYLIDAKHTVSGSYSLSSRLWMRLSEWARNEGRTPCVAVRCEQSGDVAVVPEIDYAERHPDDDTSSISAAPGLSRSIKGGQGRRVLSLSGHRVVAYDFGRFCEDAKGGGR